MYCNKCGMEVSENDKICPICGADLTKKNNDDIYSSYDKKEVGSEAQVYKVFAIIGYVSGIVSLCLAWIPFMFNLSIPGIVFSNIGAKSKSKKEFANKGFVLSIIATAINVIVTILIIVLVAYFGIKEGENFFEWINE